MYVANPTIITSGTGTGNIQQDRRPLDVSNDILMYNPNATPFTLLCQKTDSKSVKDPEFKTLEAQMQPYQDRVNNSGGYTAVAVSIVVDHGAYFKAQDLVLNTRTSEIFRVSSVSGNTLTVVRGYGSESAQAMLDDDELFRVGNAFEEGAAIDTPKTVQVDVIDNYCEIFKTSLRLTGTEMSTTLYGGADLPLRHKMSGIEHALKIEQAFLHGQRARYLTTSASNPATSHPIRLTGGIKYFISSNAIAIDGALTENLFNQTFLRPIFESDLNYRQSRVVFVSPLVAGIINNWANSKVKLIPSDKTFGIRATQYQSAHGDIQLITHPLLKGDIYSGYAYAVDLKALGYRALSERDTKLSTDVVKDGTDARTDEFLSEVGFMIRIEGVHGYASGIES